MGIGNLLMRAVSSKPVQALGNKSLDIVTSDTLQNAVSSVWSTALNAEQTLQVSIYGPAEQRREEAKAGLAAAVSGRVLDSDLEVTSESLDADLQKHERVRAALVDEALHRGNEIEQ